MTKGPPNRLLSQPSPPSPLGAAFTPQSDYVATVNTVSYDKFTDASHSEICRMPIPNPARLSNGIVVPGVQVARCWDNVRYCGCRSGCVQPGRIFSTDWCGKVEGILFCNQILFMTNPNPIGGDSGSLLINSDTNRATGLVFARIGNIFGLANHIRPVLNNLGVALA